MTNRLQGNHSHVAEAIIGLEDLIAAVGGVIIHDATSETDGVEDTFATPNEFASGKVRVFQNGLLLRPGVDFTEAGTLDAVLLTTPPAAGDELIIIYGTDGDTPLAFTQLVDTPGSYAGDEEKVVAVNAAGTALEFIDPPSASGSGVGFPDMQPASPNAMDDEFDDSSGSSGPVNGIDGKWTRRGTTAPTITWPAPSWVHFEAVGNTFGYDQAKPAGVDYEVDLRFSSGGEIGSANAFGGLYALDAVNGDMYTMHLLVGNNNARVCDIEVAQWGASGTFLGGSFTLIKGINGAPMPTNFRMRYYNGSPHWDFDVSFDGGLIWTNVWITGTDAIGHTRIGFIHTLGGSVKKNRFAVDWFRRTL